MTVGISPKSLNRATEQQTMTREADSIKESARVDRIKIKPGLNNRRYERSADLRRRMSRWGAGDRKCRSPATYTSSTSPNLRRLLPPTAASSTLPPYHSRPPNHPRRRRRHTTSPSTIFFPLDTALPLASSSSLAARVLKGSNIVLSSYAYAGPSSQVISAEYIRSSVRFEDCPSDGLPEFAFVGRFGKSSLLNSLVRRKRLALTSKKPGKTQCINHFRVNDSWYLVDLPGYGYAVAPQKLRTDWGKFTKDYFLYRSTLVAVFLLIDAGIPAKTIDLEYASWLGQNQIPVTLIFTKCDKRKKTKNGGKRPEENVDAFQEQIQGFFQTVPPWIMTSSIINQGRDEILLHIAQLRNYWLKH